MEGEEGQSVQMNMSWVWSMTSHNVYIFYDVDNKSLLEKKKLKRFLL